MKNFVFAAIGACALAGAAPSASALVVIDFDSLPASTSISNQYPELTFSYNAGTIGVALPFGGVSPPNILCTSSGGVVNCREDIFVDFTNPVNNLRFLAVEPNEFGVVARVNVFTSGMFASTVDIIGLANTPGTFITGTSAVDLSAFTNVTRIEIVGPAAGVGHDSAYGGNGIGYDRFEFDVVPSPSALALIGAGLVAAGRRRRH
jgi:hypothetical protein